ncbi:M20/M25/M40 family metallo-hydrolase [Acidobacteriota bacterium]
MRKSIYSMTTALIIVLFFAFPAEQNAQEKKTVPERWKPGFESIRSEESYAFLEFIAADELEGRDTASVGQTIARNYIKSIYKIWGIEPAGDLRGISRSFEQRIDMVEKVFGQNMRLEVLSESESRVFFFEDDFSGNMGADVPGEIDAPVVFAGYGLSAPDLNYDDFEKIDVRNRIVVVSTGKPGKDRKDSPFNQPRNLARFAGRRTPAENCARLLAEKGAKALLLIDESFSRVSNAGGYIRGSRISSDSSKVTALKLSTVDRMVPFFWVSPSVADCIFSASGTSFTEAKEKIDSSLKPNSFYLRAVSAKINLDIQRKNTVSANLLGRIEGSDPELKREYVVIGAHLDHIGMNKDGYVFNGADDNGSGSVGVMQAAKAFAINPEKPKRTILFAHWTGEEKGLLGSSHFVHFPSVPLENVVACINLDMICTDTSMDRLKQGIDEYSITLEELADFRNDPKTLLAAITSLPSPDMVEHYSQLSRDYLDLQPVPLCSDPMPGNSDHWPFSRMNIPSVFFFTMGDGLAHQPGDTVERINAEKMSKIIKLAYLLAFQIADTYDRLSWEKQ